MKNDSYILSIDQSTSGTKAVLIDRSASVVARSTIEHAQIFPQPGWVEHDPEEIYTNTLEAISTVLKQSNTAPSSIGCLSVSNQRETVLAWNRKTGRPVANAVVWQCMRGEALCRALKADGHEDLVRERTGLIIDPYFSASGLAWLLENVEGARDLAESGDLLAGTMDSWLVWKLTGGKVHATDFTNASRTMLMDLHTLSWDPEIAALFNIPRSILPNILPSDEIFGETSAEGLFETEVPISGIFGDSHAALFGQRCFTAGMSKVTYGTGSSVMMNIGDMPSSAPGGLVTSVGFSIKNRTNFVFEGNIHSTGATIKWMADSLKLLPSSAESAKIAASVEDTAGVIFIPAFAGLGAPYWNNTVRAAVLGITGGTTAAHLVRAGLESIAYQVKDLIDLMKEKAGIKIQETRVDGGPTNNDFLMQFQADMINSPIRVSDIEEASALGAGLAGGLGTGVWDSLETIEKLYKSKAVMKPEMDTEKRNKLYKEWLDAVHQLLK